MLFVRTIALDRERNVERCMMSNFGDWLVLKIVRWAMTEVDLKVGYFRQELFCWSGWLLHSIHFIYVLFQRRSFQSPSSRCMWIRKLGRGTYSDTRLFQVCCCNKAPFADLIHFHTVTLNKEEGLLVVARGMGKVVRIALEVPVLY